MSGIPSTDPDTNWNNNRIQFPRLISELQCVGAFTPEIVKCLMESMDLTESDILNVIDRADTEWQRIKNRHPK